MLQSIVTACALVLTLWTVAVAPALARPQLAPRVSIVRDDWGIAHVKGHTDADAVFGMIYAQAEDDFNRIENNYLVSLGRLAEAEKAIASKRSAAMENVRSIASEAAPAIVERLTGIVPASQDVAKAVADVLES